MKNQLAGLLTSRGLASALQAIALIVLARQVTTAAFGVVSVVTAVVGIVLVVTGLGLVVFVPQARARGENSVVAAALRLNSVSSIWTAVVMSLAVAWWLGAHRGPAGAVLVAISLTLERNVETYLGVSIADGATGVVSLSVVLRRVVALIVFGTALALGLDPVWSYGSGLLVGASVAQVHIRWALRGHVVHEGHVTSLQVARRSSSYLLANVSAQVRTLDVTVVAALLPAAATGLYAAASKLVQPLLLVPQSIAAVVGPRSTRLSGAEARRLAGRLALLFSAALVVGSPAIIWAEPLIVFVMGPRFAGAGPTLAWSLAGLPLLAVSSTYVAILQGQGFARGAAINAAVFGALLLVLVAVGAVRGGAAGAAAGLAASYVLRVAVLGVMVRRMGETPGAGQSPDG